MPISKIGRQTITISLTEEDYRYIQQQIELHQDTVHTVPGYVKRLVHHYLLSMQVEENIRESERRMKKLIKGLQRST